MKISFLLLLTASWNAFAQCSTRAVVSYCNALLFNDPLSEMILGGSFISESLESERNIPYYRFCLTKAAEQGFLAAKTQLTLDSLESQNPKVRAETIQELINLVESGSSYAAFHLARVLETGYSIPRDSDRAIEFYKMDHDTNSVCSQIRIAELLLEEGKWTLFEALPNRESLAAQSDFIQWMSIRRLPIDNPTRRQTLASLTRKGFPPAIATAIKDEIHAGWMPHTQWNRFILGKMLSDLGYSKSFPAIDSLAKETRVWESDSLHPCRTLPEAPEFLEGARHLLFCPEQAIEEPLEKVEKQLSFENEVIQYWICDGFVSDKSPFVQSYFQDKLQYSPLIFRIWVNEEVDHERLLTALWGHCGLQTNPLANRIMARMEKSLGNNYSAHLYEYEANRLDQLVADELKGSGSLISALVLLQSEVPQDAIDRLDAKQISVPVSIMGKEPSSFAEMAGVFLDDLTIGYSLETNVVVRKLLYSAATNLMNNSQCPKPVRNQIREYFATDTEDKAFGRGAQW